jgi:hypothetical protein
VGVCSGRHTAGVVGDNIAFFKSTMFTFLRSDFCEIEHYCYAMNFGEGWENALITVEDLWNILQCNKKLADSIITKDVSVLKEKESLINEDNSYVFQERIFCKIAVVSFLRRGNIIGIPEFHIIT